MALKLQTAYVDNISMDEKRDLTRRYAVIQWIGVVIAILGFAYNGVKDYQKGEIKLPALQQKQELTKTNHPIQYCLMAYDPNLDKVFYQHENGQWYDYAPQQRRYATTPQVRHY
jgi:cellulase/cellobiase CelA1